MKILYQLLMTILKLIGAVASFLNIECSNTIEGYIRDFENEKAATEKKYYQSVVAAKEWKNDELKKIYKEREELELRYSGNIVDLQEERKFQSRLERIKTDNELYKSKIQSEIESLQADISALNN